MTSQNSHGDPVRFLPPTPRGYLVLGGGLFLSIAMAITSFWFSGRTENAIWFVIFLVLGIAFCFPLLPLMYRIYALFRAYYDLDREYLTIHWGLRTEKIPLHHIEWLRPDTDLIAPLPLPRLGLPGAYLGTRQVEGLGPVEFLASARSGLVLVAAPSKVFVLSPAQPDTFMAYFYRTIELGSLHQEQAESIQPAVILGKMWEDRNARWLVSLGFLAGVILAVTVGIFISTRPEMSLGFAATGIANPRVPSIRMLLLPVLNGFIFLIDLVGGAFFYRSASLVILAYLLWGGSIGVSILLFISVLLSGIFA